MPPSWVSPPRAASWILAGVYFFLAGMLLYFRLGPFAQVLDRIRREGGTVPEWYPWAATGVFGLGTVYLAWRGLRYLRVARG